MRPGPSSPLTRTRRASALAIAVTAASLVTCRSATEIVVTVTSEVDCKDSPSTAIVVGRIGALETDPPASTSTACAASGRVGSIVIVPSSAEDESVAFKIVQGFAGGVAEDCMQTGNYDRCIVARRALHYLPHGALRVVVPMRVSCKGIPCSPTDTCVRGSCVSATIGDLSTCQAAGGCDEGALGGDVGQGDAGPDATLSDGGPVVGCVGSCPGPLAAPIQATCALTSGAVAKCWGDDGYAELGQGGTGNPDPSPNPLPLGGIDALVAGGNAACALHAGGHVACWGESDGVYALLGFDAQGAPIGTPTDVPALLGVTNVGLGGTHVCWSDGAAAHCIGANDFGQLGAGDLAPHSGAVAPRLPAGAVAGVAAGMEAACAILKADGSVWCWGRNTHGQIDPPTLPAPVATPVKTDLSPLGSKAVDVQVGPKHLCALLADTTVACWGNDNEGETGHAPTGDTGFPPERVRLADGTTPLTGATKIVVGWEESCAIVAGGKVKCWGGNRHGELGRGGALLTDGGLVEFPFADDVLGLDQVTALAAGAWHVCALRGAGEIWCWGDNTSGAAGLDLQTQTAPRKVLP